MKALNHILLIFLVVSISWGATAQIEKVDHLKDFQILESQGQPLLTARSRDIPGNQIFIEQIGSENTINFEITATKSKVDYTQNGIGNLIDASILASTYNSGIIQNGSNNRIIDEINASTDEVVLNLTQEGHFQNFERYGSNSIGDKINFKMTGDFNSIIVRNFK